MPRILHLIDGGDPEELRLALQPLIARLPAKDWDHHIVALSGRQRLFDYLGERKIARLPVRLGMHFLSGPALRDYLTQHRIDLIHAWSLDAAYLATLACDWTTPVLLSRWDPDVSLPQARRLAALMRLPRVAVICQAGTVERRLFERGVPRERLVVVRPGVDFGLINRLKRSSSVREDLAIDSDHTVVLLNPHHTRQGRHLEGAWVVEAARHLQPRLVLLTPESSPDRPAIERFMYSVGASVYRVSRRRHSLEELLAASDLLLAPATTDVSTTAVAWAMASAVPILGCATYALAEFIADGQNGHLARNNDTMPMAGKLVDVLRDRRQNAAFYDQARAEAFEAFGLSRYVGQVQQVYENLLQSREVGTDIVDRAFVS